MKHIIFSLLILCLLVSCSAKISSPDDEKHKIDKLINEWHIDAAKGNLEAYFDKMTDDAYFIGTDASEKWNASEFKTFCEPHFADGGAWDFKPLKREIFLNDRQDFAWFDEQLDTWMGVCMSSGVLVKIEDEWKIKHYQLSIAVPNDLVQDFIELMESSQNTNPKN
jgi:hypothetical protein